MTPDRLRITSHPLRVTYYALRITGYVLRITDPHNPFLPGWPTRENGPFQPLFFHRLRLTSPTGSLRFRP